MASINFLRGGLFRSRSILTWQEVSRFSWGGVHWCATKELTGFCSSSVSCRLWFNCFTHQIGPLTEIFFLKSIIILTFNAHSENFRRGCAFPCTPENWSAPGFINKLWLKGNCKNFYRLTWQRLQNNILSITEFLHLLYFVKYFD